MAGLFNRQQEAAPPPVKPPAPMPDTSSAEVKESERSRMAQILGRGGRRSTILTGMTDSTGGGEGDRAYTRKTLA